MFGFKVTFSEEALQELADLGLTTYVICDALVSPDSVLFYSGPHASKKEITGYFQFGGNKYFVMFDVNSEEILVTHCYAT